MNQRSASILAGVIFAAVAAYGATGEDGLIAQLGSPDRNIRNTAAIALGQRGAASSRAVAPLTKALSDSDPFVQSNAAKALGNLGAAASGSVSALLHAQIPRGYDENIPVEALIAIGPTVVVPLAIKALTDSELETRSRAIRTLWRFGLEAGSAVPALKSSVSRESGETRWLAAMALTNIDPTAKEGLPALVEGLNSTNRDTRRWSEAKLKQLGPVGAAAIKAAPPKPGTDTPEGALWLLDSAGQLNEWKAARDAIEKLGPGNDSALRKYVADKSKDGRKRAIVLGAVLKHLPPEQMRQEFNRALTTDKDRDFRVSCVMAMGKTRDPLFKPTFKAILADQNEDGSVQTMVAQALAAMGDDSGKARALKAVTDANGYQDFGTQALVIMKAVDTVPSLRVCANGTDYSKKNSCRSAVLRIQIATNPKDELKFLAEALKEEGYFDTRGWAARHLAELKTKEALAVLCENSRNGVSQALDGLRMGTQNGGWTREETASCGRR